jgi:Protein of unknown function (DUF1186)/SEC-C motif
MQDQMQSEDAGAVLAELAALRPGAPLDAARRVLAERGLADALALELSRIAELPDPAQALEGSMLHLNAMVLLAARRDTRAFRPLLKLASGGEDVVEDIFGDFLTEDWACAIAATCDDQTLIKDFILQDAHSMWPRICALEALQILVMQGDADCAATVQWLRDFGLRLERRCGPDADDDDGMLLTETARLLSELSEPSEMALIGRWWDAGLLDPQICARQDYVECLTDSAETRAARFAKSQRGYRRDPLALMARWHVYSDAYHEEVPQDQWPNDAYLNEIPYVRPYEKVGRNDPCPCNSGKKYKKCCGQ